jgi:hypothetical protein
LGVTLLLLLLENWDDQTVGARMVMVELHGLSG